MNLSLLSARARETLLMFIEERFGIENSVFSGLELLENVKGRVFVMNSKTSGFAKDGNIACASLPFARINGSVKPTSVMIQIFGRHARKSVVELDSKKAKEFMEGFDLSIENHSCTDGYVVVKYKNYPLGCGLLKGNEIKNMLPKAKRMPVELL